MTDQQQHPITPPIELRKQWRDEALNLFPDDENPCPCDIDDARDEYIATQAARWGADQELGASLAWLISNQNPRWALALQEGRRPKPKSQAEEALKAIGVPTKIGEARVIEHNAHELIRAALERLRELEKSND